MEVKLTQEDGTDCYSGTIKFVPGQISEAPDWEETRKCGKGLHFGTPNVCLIGVALSDAAISVPTRAFEVQPMGKVIELEPGKKKAKQLLTVRELDFRKILAELALDPNSEVRREVARNPKAYSKTLTILSEDPDRKVRREVAGNTNTRSEVLEWLSRDTDCCVRSNVAGNPNTPSEVLRKLKNDEIRCVIESVSANPKTPTD